MITTAKILFTLFVIANNGEGIALPVKNFASLTECESAKIEHQRTVVNSDITYACF